MAHQALTGKLSPWFLSVIIQFSTSLECTLAQKSFYQYYIFHSCLQFLFAFLLKIVATFLDILNQSVPNFNQFVKVGKEKFRNTAFHFFNYRVYESFVSSNFFLRVLKTKPLEWLILSTSSCNFQLVNYRATCEIEILFSLLARSLFQLVHFCITCEIEILFQRCELIFFY